MFLYFALITFGVSVFLYLLKYILNFSRKWDWDGFIERFFIGIVFLSNRFVVPIIALIIVIRIVYYIYRSLAYISVFRGEGLEFQKIQFKEEMLLDIILSPLLAIIISILMVK